MSESQEIAPPLGVPADAFSARAQPEAAVFASEHPVRRFAVRATATALGLLFIAWVIALVTGVSGFGGLPGLQEMGSGQDSSVGAASDRTNAASAVAVTDRPLRADHGGALRTAAPSPGTVGATTDQRAPTRRATRPVSSPTGTSTTTTPRDSGASTQGKPEVTPGGNVPGANANWGGAAAGDRPNGGQGGGKPQ